MNEVTGTALYTIWFPQQTVLNIIPVFSFDILEPCKFKVHRG